MKAALLPSRGTRLKSPSEQAACLLLHGYIQCFKMDITALERTGFTVVEWGGCQVK